jgi:quinolinate synthase
VSKRGDEHGRAYGADPLICPCSTMFRINGPHRAWVLQSLVHGDVAQQITVDEHTTERARVALERMLEITCTGASARSRPRSPRTGT